MKLKEFLEDIFKESPFHAISTVRDLIELEGIEQRLNVIWGVELDITVKPAPKREGKFYGKSMVDAIEKAKKGISL